MVNSWVSRPARSTPSLLQFLLLLFLTLLMAASAPSNSQPDHEDPALKVMTRSDRRSRISCGRLPATTNSELHDHHHHLQQEPCTPQTPSRTRTRLINSRSFQGYIVTREMIGSSPPTCRGRCGRCAPCRAIHVPIQPGKDTPLEYYPEAWRCKCGNRLFMP